MNILLLLLGLIVVAGVFAGKRSTASEQVPADEDDADQRWAELVSADQCDTFWDPPGDDT